MRLLLLMMFSLFAMNASSQDTESATPWQQGDVFVGINSNLDGENLLTMSLEPTVGLALSDLDIISASVAFSDVNDNTEESYSIGYQRLLTGNLYAGASFAYSNSTSSESRTDYGVSLGYFGNLNDTWYVSPSIELALGDDATSVNTNITFGLRL